MNMFIQIGIPAGIPVSVTSALGKLTCAVLLCVFSGLGWRQHSTDVWTNLLSEWRTQSNDHRQHSSFELSAWL